MPLLKDYRPTRLAVSVAARLYRLSATRSSGRDRYPLTADVVSMT